MEEFKDPAESKRPILVGYASMFGVEILPDETALEAGVESLMGFLAEIDMVDLEGVAPAAVYDPAWPRVNEVPS